MSTARRGTAANVPYLAVPPASGAANAPVVVGWHLMDAPRSEAAFAAALPLDGLDAWRIYLGLPMFGTRMPAGGMEEIMRLGFEDAVLNLQGPIIAQATDEFAPAFAQLRAQLGFGDGPLGLFGGSAGAAVALNVLAQGTVPAQAAVLVSPLVQLRPAVEALSRQFGMDYPWAAESDAVARRLDFVARAGEIAAHGTPATLLVLGADDDAAGFLEPAQNLAAALGAHYGDTSRVRVESVAGMGHALAEDPGIEPAPQTPHAVQVDRQASAWFRAHLG